MQSHLKKQDRAFQASANGRTCILYDFRPWECRTNVGLARHHLIKRRFRDARWTEINGPALCLDCHAWAEANPVESEPLIVEAMVIRGYLADPEEFERLKTAVRSGDIPAPA